jgi:anti-sigma factor RsiW
VNCSDFEILLADHLDGTLPASSQGAFEAHAKSCPACGHMMQDAAGVVQFLERVPAVVAPPQLVTKLLFEVSAGASRKLVKPSWVRRWFGSAGEKFLEPVLQPRFAMGMAMTVLSFAMLGRVTGIEMKQLKPSDLDPVKVWAAAEDRAHRVWDRGMKYYDNLRLVYLIQTRLKEWSDEQPEGQTNSGGNAPGGNTK